MADDGRWRREDGRETNNERRTSNIELRTKNGKRLRQQENRYQEISELVGVAFF